LNFLESLLTINYQGSVSKMADASAPSPAPNNVELPSADQEPTANGTAAMDVEMKEEPIADVKSTLNSYCP
jgi:hypothetical protein